MSERRLPAIAVAAAIGVCALFGAAKANSGRDAAAAIPSANTGFAAGAHAWVQSRPRLRLTTGTARLQENDYPTSERADYVIGCIAANGNTREALLKCACAIDTIAGLMPYADYEKAETALSLQLGGGVGGRVGLFRDPPQCR
jgi:hypothetical protein